MLCDWSMNLPTDKIIKQEFVELCTKLINYSHYIIRKTKSEKLVTNHYQLVKLVAL